MQNFDDTFLARWIADKASAEEVMAFKKHPEYKSYLKIKQASNSLSFSEFNEETSFNNLKTKLNTRKKVKTIPSYIWAVSIAACTTLIFGLFFYLNQSTTYSTTIAENNTINFPDGSVIILNALASVKVNTKNWEENREVFLEGEAFFKVKEGSNFIVNTNLGKVEVLGTQFTVNTITDNLITVKCFKGKVKVETPMGKAVLTKGKAFQDNNINIETWDFNKETPSWITTKETSLYKVPIENVIASMQRQYNIKIQQQELLNKKQLFTGTFSNTDLEKALYSVFGVLGVDYTLISANEIRILPE